MMIGPADFSQIIREGNISAIKPPEHQKSIRI